MSSDADIPSGRVPDVVIGGAPRSGTTYLAEALSRHPQIYVAHPLIPEPKVCMTASPDGEAGYRARYARLFAAAPEGRILIEKTSAYLENADALGWLRAVVPQGKYIFLLREPVMRAYSNWLRTRAQGLEMLSFAEAVAQEGERPNPLKPERAYARPFDYLIRGRYDVFALRWFDAFPRESILFLVFEETMRDPQGMLRKVEAFIGVKTVPYAALPAAPVNASMPGEPMLDRALESRLRAQMRPHVEALASLCPELNLSVWGYG